MKKKQHSSPLSQKPKIIRTNSSPNLINPSSSTNQPKINNFNRRLVINPRTYIKAGINTSDNTITIADHGYISGQKVISTATTSPGGLVDNGIYYVVVVDKDKIKLSNQYYQSY